MQAADSGDVRRLRAVFVEVAQGCGGKMQCGSELGGLFARIACKDGFPCSGGNAPTFVEIGYAEFMPTQGLSPDVVELVLKRNRIG